MKILFLSGGVFQGKENPRVQDRLAELGVVATIAPKDMTHLLQPLDVTTNGNIKKIEKKELSNYIISIITNKMLIDLSRDVTTIRIDLKLSTLKSFHLNTPIQIFSYFNTSVG